MTAIIGPLASAMNIAANAGVPYIGIAGGIVQEINAKCEKVSIHKSDCKRLANKAAKLSSLLEEHRAILQESQLKEYADDIDQCVSL